VNRWIRLGTNHMAEHCYRRYPSPLWLISAMISFRKFRNLKIN
jgi:hypothetical protein